MKKPDPANLFEGRAYSRVLALVVDTPFGPATLECQHQLSSFTKVQAVFECLDGSRVESTILHCERCDCYAIPDAIPECPPAPDETDDDPI